MHHTLPSWELERGIGKLKSRSSAQKGGEFPEMGTENGKSRKIHQTRPELKTNKG